MEEIKVGEYVRTKTGNITKVVAVKDDYVWTDEFIDLLQYKYNEGIIENTEIVKHSPNIIDLIEVGDYVNGSEVIDIAEAPVRAVYTEDREQKLALIPIINEQIKSVVTKEQFNQVKYEV